MKLSAQGSFEDAILLTQGYIADLEKERIHAEEAIRIVQRILAGESTDPPGWSRRKEVADILGISMDSLRNWELNGLLTVKRKQNGYRVYSQQDIKRLKVIRSLRCANYSLEAILRMLNQLDQDPGADIRLALNTPRQDAEIISVCDRLIVSLSSAEENALKMLNMLKEMQKNF